MLAQSRNETHSKRKTAASCDKRCVSSSRSTHIRSASYSVKRSSTDVVVWRIPAEALKLALPALQCLGERHCTCVADVVV